MRFFENYRKNIHANVSIMMAASIGALGIATGAAVDVLRLSSHDQKLQDALDASTLYATRLEGAEDYREQAQIFLSKSVEDLELKGLKSNFQKVGNRVVGTANADLDLVFAGLLGMDDSGIGARTVVNIPGSSLCIVALNEKKTGALRLNSGANVETEGCEVHVHSTNPNALIINSSSNLEAARTCIAGGVLVNVGGASGELETSCNPDPDPYAGAFPEPDSTVCNYYDEVYEDDSIRLKPGVYCGDHIFSGSVENVDLDPGLYVIKDGSWVVDDGKWDGQGITFYFADESTFQFNSSVEVDFSAPTTGTYADALMTEAPGLKNTAFVLNDSLGYDFDGVIHLPSREITLNSGANVTSEGLSVVADTIIVNNLTLQGGADDDSGANLYISE